MNVAQQQDRVRHHPLRLKILALSIRRKQSLDPEDLRRELPEHPTVAAIEYHLLVLRQVELLPSD
jgi:hypothetical protein